MSRKGSRSRSIVTLRLGAALSLATAMALVGPAARSLGASAFTVDSTADKVDVFGFKWSHVGQSSKHIPFDWTGPG